MHFSRSGFRRVKIWFSEGNKFSPPLPALHSLYLVQLHIPPLTLSKPQTSSDHKSNLHIRFPGKMSVSSAATTSQTSRQNLNIDDELARSARQLTLGSVQYVEILEGSAQHWALCSGYTKQLDDLQVSFKVLMLLYISLVIFL